MGCNQEEAECHIFAVLLLPGEEARNVCDTCRPRVLLLVGTGPVIDCFRRRFQFNRFQFNPSLAATTGWNVMPWPLPRT